MTGGDFVVNGVAQTGGHEIDVTPANVANTVFDAGTAGGSDQLWAQLMLTDGTLSGWQQFSVTVPASAGQGRRRQPVKPVSDREPRHTRLPAEFRVG